MMKQTFFLLAIVAIAFVAAEDDVFNTADELELIEEPLNNENEEIVDDEIVNEDDAKVSFVSVKATSEDRQAAREELAEAFMNANLDSAWLEQQELLETKEQGSGYGEMKEIMAKVDELEKKISDRLAKDLKYITKKRAYCAKTRAKYERNLRNLARRIKKNNRVITYQQASIDKNLAGRARSRQSVGKYEKTINQITKNREIDVAGYKKRLLKRLKEIKVLHACNMLVCTEFSDFKNTKLCKEIVKNGAKTEDSKAQVTTTPLRDLLKEADKAEKKHNEALKKEQAETKKAVSEGKKAETLKKNAAPTTKTQTETETRMAELLELLQDSDLPQRTFAPARRVIYMIRTGKKAEPTKSLKEMTLPESLVHLLQRIVNDQKRETIDYMNQLKKYHEEIKKTGDAIDAEVSRQQDLANRIQTSNKHIERARTDNGRRALQRDVTTKALRDLNTDCRNEDEAYAKRREGRKGELVNIEKLRSLLRVLQKSDLPKCPSDCTNPEQGKCIWKGLYGKDSYCACRKGFHGKACEKRMCPGPNGVLYKATQRGVCSRRGKCDESADKGSCTCFNGYYHGQHKSCEFKVCPGGGNCNGKGRCDKKTGKCVCYSKYYGHDCAHHKCPGAGGVLFQANNRAVCSGNGACNIKTGKCGCSSRFTGRYCQSYLCPGNCSGRGNCNTRNGKCECRGNYFGKRCEFIRCSENCGGSVAGRCDYNVGRCQCNAGYSGPSCRRVSHCQHSTVNNYWWTRGHWRWANCPSGMLLMKVMRLHHDDLSGMRYMQCARPCEGGRPAALSTCKVNDWTHSFDRQGWSTCEQGFYINGLLRSSCNWIYCLERVRCCSVQRANGYARCYNHNWWGCLDRNNWCGVHNGYFVRGLYRTGGHRLHNIEEASSCMFRRTSTAPQL